MVVRNAFEDMPTLPVQASDIFQIPKGESLAMGKVSKSQDVVFIFI